MNCPSSTVFLDIFKFLLQLVGDSYQLPKKYEEVIPVLLKNMGKRSAYTLPIRLAMLTITFAITHQLSVAVSFFEGHSIFYC